MTRQGSWQPSYSYKSTPPPLCVCVCSTCVRTHCQPLFNKSILLLSCVRRVNPQHRWSHLFRSANGLSPGGSFALRNTSSFTPLHPLHRSPRPQGSLWHCHGGPTAAHRTATRCTDAIWCKDTSRPRRNWVHKDLWGMTVIL